MSEPTTPVRSEPQGNWAQWRPVAIALAVVLVYWGALLLLSGAFFCGYQLVDDHEQVRIQADLKAPGATLGGVVAKWVATDFGIRFRPLYYIHRIALVKLLGLHWTLWELHQAALAILTSMLLYAFARRVGLGWTAGVLIPLLALSGAQAAIYWRLGPQETPGMLLLALSLYLMALSVTAARRRLLYEALFLLAAALAALCKESFVLVLPALAFWRVWLSRATVPGGTWRQAIIRSQVSVAALLVICIVCLLVILTWVGTEKTGYAGLQGTGLMAAFHCLWVTFNRFEWYIMAAGLAMAVSVDRRAWLSAGPERTRILWALLPPFLLLAMIVVPQGYLYARSDMFERYRLPAAFGIAFLLAWLYDRIRARHRLLSFVFLALLLASIVWQTSHAWRAARGWAMMGRATQAFLTGIERRSDANSRIIVVADPARNNEAAMSVNAWLRLARGRPNTYVYPVLAPPYTPFERELIARDEFRTWFEGRVADRTTAPRADVIAVLQGSDPAFWDPRNRPAWFDPRAWQRRTFGGDLGMVLYSPAARAGVN